MLVASFEKIVNIEFPRRRKKKNKTKREGERIVYILYLCMKQTAEPELHKIDYTKLSVKFDAYICECIRTMRRTP